ncbi:hypothetical protein [Kiritimatiella glycovorans]|uniref:DUF3108 domain-containing protein n=1 Tax=Kiritimatiella glycovorans TaxID=1307763 RepID=A0A0G3EH21_9BACT|nr:hypothetical protein [Kiritimatiella glycovorans]AKJ64717.1 hypothetical protein L21SP4_01471 [Kiritimatiella glycovorans]
MNPIPFNQAYSLALYRPVLDGFTPPDGEHDPGRDHTLTFGIYEFMAAPKRSGTLTIRSERGANGVVVRVDYVKKAPGDYENLLHAEIHCGGEGWPDLRRWNGKSEMRGPDGRVLPLTEYAFEGRRESAEWVFKTGKSERRLPRLRPALLPWTAWAALARMNSDEAFSALHCDFIEDGEHLKHDQRLDIHRTGSMALGGKRAFLWEERELDAGTLRSPSEVRDGGRDLEVTAFCRTGEGSVPTFYWIAKREGPLFMTAGTHAWIRET